MSLGALRICGDQQGVCADSGTPGRYRWVSVQEAANGYDTYVAEGAQKLEKAMKKKKRDRRDTHVVMDPCTS